MHIQVRTPLCLTSTFVGRRHGVGFHIPSVGLSSPEASLYLTSPTRRRRQPQKTFFVYRLRAAPSKLPLSSFEVRYQSYAIESKTDAMSPTSPQIPRYGPRVVRCYECFVGDWWRFWCVLFLLLFRGGVGPLLFRFPWLLISLSMISLPWRRTSFAEFGLRHRRRKVSRSRRRTSALGIESDGILLVLAF